MDVRPSWQNLNGAAQAFSGLLLTIVSSPGCQQAFVDNQAGYGTVPSGATTRCTDCYAVYAVSRCRQHWDIWTIEGLAPDDLGQVRQWNLHVGGSFADVARTNPFYRFIETLFHHRATGGCTATDYCPSSATTREQMPVFM